MGGEQKKEKRGWFMREREREREREGEREMEGESIIWRVD
jgi:hypothetical protein